MTCSVGLSGAERKGRCDRHFLGESMSKIRFQYRALYDVVVAYGDCALETEADVVAWHGEYDAYFRARFTRKVDLILELSKFHFNPKLADSFGRHRARVLSEFTIRSY